MQFITSNFLPISLAIVSGVMILWSLFGNRFRGVKEVDTNGALQLINHKNAAVLDVREPDEFKLGHLLNSIHIPLSKLKERIGELEKYKTHPLLIICRSGNRSGTACAILSQRGFSQAYVLSRGVMGWQKANLPVQK
ncbi:MAG: rhodanese-like domain-containing protein [Gallionella sp.]